VLEPITLPYDSLQPALSDSTLDLHYGLYLSYMERVAESGAPDLESAIAIAAESHDVALLHSAQQAQNHELYFMGMRPDGGGLPGGRLFDCFQRTWANEDVFREAFIRAAMGLFGSGWIWLVCQGDHVEIVQAPNSDQPRQLGGGEVVLAFDVWEHAYVCDYGGARGTYAQVYLEQLVDWGYAEALLDAGAFR
jgi:Fe-Mn family superoxide dismutase